MSKEKKASKQKVNSKSIKYITSLLDKLMQERQVKLDRKYKHKEVKETIESKESKIAKKKNFKLLAQEI